MLPDGRELIAWPPEAMDRLREATRAADMGEYPREAGAWGTEDGLQVLVTMDPTHFGKLLHLSISYQDRYPSWEEVRDVKRVFFPPQFSAMMVLPAEAEYINIHNFCLQVIQTPHAWVTI
jgi:hypothetical protein